MGSSVSRISRLLAACGLACGAALTSAAPASADDVDGGGGGYADLAFTGTTGSYQGSVTLRGGFPITTYTSTSRSGAVGIQTGNSTFLNAATPPGAAYGLSQGRPYLNLRPSADNATSPSRTVYTFTEPTPTSGWALVLGDVDADRVVVTALDADGAVVPVGDLGFAGVFNYCGGTPSPCTRTTPPDLPSWDPATATLNGNLTAVDTAGGSAWFQPRVPLSQVRLTFYQRSGFPVYQTWFASRANDVTGTVTGCQVAGLPVSLLDGATGRVVATTVTGPDGGYGFLRFTATDYAVSLDVPRTCETPAAEQDADLTGGDQTVDFALTPVVDTPTSSPTPTPTPASTPTPAPTPTPSSAPATTSVTAGSTTESVPDGGILPDTGG